MFTKPPPPRRRIRYQRVTLIDKLFGGHAQLRFCAVLLIDGKPNKCVGYVFSAPDGSRRTAIEEWFAYINNHLTTWATATRAHIEDSFCVARTPDAPFAYSDDSMLDALIDEHATLSVATDLALSHTKARIIDYDTHARWIEALYDYVDTVNSV